MSNPTTENIYDVMKGDYLAKFDSPFRGEAGSEDAIIKICGYGEGKYNPVKLRAMWAHYLDDRKETDFGHSIKRFTDARVLNRYAVRVKGVKDLRKGHVRNFGEAIRACHKASGLGLNELMASGETFEGPLYECEGCGAVAPIIGNVWRITHPPSSFKCHICGGIVRHKSELDDERVREANKADIDAAVAELEAGRPGLHGVIDAVVEATRMEPAPPAGEGVDLGDLDEDFF